MNELMTETDALALCIAEAMTSAWGKSEATSAVKHATNLFQAKKIDAETLAAVVGRLGNHSATRQHLEKNGLLKTAPDALAQAIRKAIDGETAKVNAALNV